MLILQERCTGCGECAPDCPQQAIAPSEGGRYAINPAACDDCAEMLEPRCARDCHFGAIARPGLDGAPLAVVADPIAHYRPVNLAYLVIALSPKGHDFYRTLPWPNILALVAQLYAEPEMQARVSTRLDDFCVRCAAKTNPAHRAANYAADQQVMARLGVERGQVLPLLELIRKLAQAYTEADLRQDVKLKEAEYQLYGENRGLWL